MACRLDHINETRITKLHKEECLDPFDYESNETCESCLLGKMAKSHLVQKEKEQECCLNLYIWMYMVQ